MKKRARLYLKTPEQKWLLRGGLAACTPPFLIAVFAIVTSPNKTNTLIFYILAVCILVGMAIAAILGTREIKHKNIDGFSGKGSFVAIAIKAGFFAHWATAAGLYLYALMTSPFANGLPISVTIIIQGSIFTFILWVSMTLPVSIACGFIFWFVAVRGAPDMMADVFD